MVTLLDTGPLVTFLGSGLHREEWVHQQWKRLRPPLITCEPVLTEAAFLLKREGIDPDGIFELVARGIVEIGLEIQSELADIRALMRRYRDQPMSLADACLVRLTELNSNAVIFTLDSDFRIYRRHGNKVIQTLMPN